MIVYDTPAQRVVRTKYGLTRVLMCHLLSDQHGVFGTEELMEFCHGRGWPTSSIVDRGQITEHVPLYGAGIVLTVRSAGAVEVGRTELLRIVEAKR